jgi:hypothetical protein
LIATSASGPPARKNPSTSIYIPGRFFPAKRLSRGRFQRHFRSPQRLCADRDSDAPRNKAAAPTRELGRPRSLNRHAPVPELTHPRSWTFTEWSNFDQLGRADSLIDRFRVRKCIEGIDRIAPK